MRIFLATCEHKQHYRVATAIGIKNILFSYYHLSNNPAVADEMFDSMNANEQNAICDSGLFTMMFGAGKDKTYTKVELLDYTKRYIERAKKFSADRLTIVEMDTHKILPLADLFEFRKHFEQSGVDVMYVWHREEGIDGLLKLAERYSYIALSVPELRILCKGTKTRYEDVVKDLLRKVSRVSPRPRVHLLGNTVMETMETSDAFSCDSSSWTYGVRHCRPTFYQNGKLFQRYAGRDTEPAWADKFENAIEAAAALNPALQKMISVATEKNKSYIKQLAFSALSYRNYQDFLDAKYSAKGLS